MPKGLPFQYEPVSGVWVVAWRGATGISSALCCLGVHAAGVSHTEVFFPLDDMSILHYLWVLVLHLGLCASFTTLQNIYIIIALAGSFHFVRVGGP